MLYVTGNRLEILSLSLHVVDNWFDMLDNRLHMLSNRFETDTEHLSLTQLLFTECLGKPGSALSR